MSLRQAKLQFESMNTRRQSNIATYTNTTRPTPSPSSTASSDTLPGDDDPDTIVVAAAEYPAQLPTPDESTAGGSCDSTHNISIQQVLASKAHRIVQTDPKQQCQDYVVESTCKEKGRNVSGETLVPNTSPSSLLRNGITALDLPWSVTSLVQHGNDKAEEVSRRSSETAVLSSDEDRRRLEKATLRRAKKEEKTSLWESRKKAAQEKAIRRSSRASMLGKAGEAVSGLTISVLGKRPREAFDRGIGRLGELKRRASQRPKSMVEPLLSTTPAFEGPTAKGRRLSDGDLRKGSPVAQGLSIPRKPLPVRKDKKWINSGLYTGQTRDFNGKLSESKNKRKYDAIQPTTENKTLPLPMFAGERLMKQGRDFRLPYDVFSPLPAGQPRPDEWRKTNKNVFVGDAAQVWRHSKPREHSTCMCTKETDCNDHCMNRFMFYECDDKNCNLPNCSNRSFHSLAQRSKKGGKYNIGVEVIQTPDRGFGVRSNRTFEPNQIIVEYTGEIITQDECDERMNTLYKDNECYYLMLFDQNMIIDATRGSIARFVNHSCEPNCRMEKWTVGDKPRMALFAGEKGIMTGDELTYDYNFDPFSQKNVQQCRCGSSKCRGVLGPKPKDERKPRPEKSSTAAADKLAGAKRKMTEMLDEGAERWNKKARLAVPKSAVVALKKVNATVSRAKVSGAGSTRSSTRLSPAKAVSRTALVKKPASRVSSLSAGGAIARRPSMLRRIVNGAQQSPRRSVSNSSATEALLQGKAEQQPLSRKEGVKAKATGIRNNVFRTVRSTRGGV